MDSIPRTGPLPKELLDEVQRSRAATEQLEPAITDLLKALGGSNIGNVDRIICEMTECGCNKNIPGQKVCTSRVIGVLAKYGLEMMYVHMAETEQLRRETSSS